MVPVVCRATIGQVGNPEHELITIGKQDVNVTWALDLLFVVLL